MNPKNGSRSGSRLSFLKIAHVICAALILFSSPLARGEAASDLLGRYTCSQAQELIETDPVQIFNMWLNSDEYIGKSKYSKWARDRVGYWGPYQSVLENTDLVNTMIEGLDEATKGTAENTVKIFAKFFIKKTMKKVAAGTAAGGVLGAVITIGEELYQFASDLNAEILDINVRNIAAAVMGEHPVSGKNTDSEGQVIFHPKPELLNEKYFLESYLGWDGEKFIRYDNFSEYREMYARRSMLVDYAGLKLGWDVTGKENTLGGWKLNEIRTAIHILLKDVSEVVEKKRIIKQKQGELKQELVELKRGQAVLSTFQSLTQQVLAMTCQDASQPCLDAESNALSKIEDYILSANDSFGVAPNTMSAFKDSVNGFYGSLERIDSIMQTDYKTGLEGYCRAVMAASSLLAEGIAKTTITNTEIAAKVSQAHTHREEACSATSAPRSKEAAELAESMSDAAETLFANTPSLSSYDLPGPAPSKMEFSGREGDLARLEQQLGTYRLAVDKSLKGRPVAIKHARIARGSVKYMVQTCSANANSAALSKIAAPKLEARIKKVEDALPEPDYQDMFLEGLSSKLDAARWHLSSLKGQNESYRTCLNGLPDLQPIRAELNGLLEQGAAGVGDAKGHATSAFACYHAWEEVSDCEVKTDCDDGLMCEAGQCVDLQPVGCLTNSDCAPGFVCPDTGLCTKQDEDPDSQSDEEPLFSVSGTEELQDDSLFSVSGAEELREEEPLFSVAGVEDVTDSSTSVTPSINCDHIPGSTAVQGNCICIDGLILSPSRGRCISCDEYFQAASSAVSDGNYSAAQAIVSEARECSSWVSHIQQQINDAASNQVCDTIAANIRAACQTENAPAVSGFMAQANQSNCNIDDNLWQWGNMLITQHNQRIDDQLAAEQRQAQASTSNEPNWMDVMAAVVQGVQDVQSGSSSRSGQGRSSGGQSLPSSIPQPTMEIPPMPGMEGVVYEGSGPFSRGNSGTQAQTGSQPGSNASSGSSTTGASGGMSAKECELHFCPVCAKATAGVDLMGVAVNPQCNDCRSRYKSKIDQCTSQGGTGKRSSSESQFNTYSVLECKKRLTDSEGKTVGYHHFFEVSGPDRERRPPIGVSCWPISKCSWKACLDKANDLNRSGNTHYNVNP